MFKKLLSLFIAVALLVPATAFAKGMPDFAATGSEPQNFKAKDQGKATAEVDLEITTQNQDGQGDISTPGKGSQISKINKQIRDERKALNAKHKELRRELKEKIKDEKAGLKANHKALKAEEKNRIKAQKDALREARKAQKLNAINLIKIESGNDSDTATGKPSQNDSDTIENKPSDDDSTSVENKPSAEPTSSIENNPSAESSPTAMHRGKGIANAISRILRNMERTAGIAAFSLKLAVTKFASWLNLNISFNDSRQ